VTVEDLVLVAGMATLRVEYDPLMVLQEGLTESSLRLNWWDEGQGQWVLAGRSGNNDNTSGQFVLGSPTEILGDWGVDTVADCVWANIDHASTYSVAGNAVPEPASIALLWLATLITASRYRCRWL
jgi:hypothetical protein